MLYSILLCGPEEMQGPRKRWLLALQSPDLWPPNISDIGLHEVNYSRKYMQNNAETYAVHLEQRLIDMRWSVDLLMSLPNVNFSRLSTLAVAFGKPTGVPKLPPLNLHNFFELCLQNKLCSYTH